MTTRHHVTGRYAVRGNRQPVKAGPHAPAVKGNKAANAAFNAHAAKSNKPAARATAGQIVSSTKTN